MSDIEITYYKGFSVQALIYKYIPRSGRARERLYDVSVRIGRQGDSAITSPVFKYPLLEPFMNLGDARRAGVAYAHKIINGDVPGSSMEAPNTGPEA